MAGLRQMNKEWDMQLHAVSPEGVVTDGNRGEPHKMWQFTEASQQHSRHPPGLVLICCGILHSKNSRDSVEKIKEYKLYFLIFWCIRVAVAWHTYAQRYKICKTLF